jgi:cysteinyl-tRNA synthetase
VGEDKMAKALRSKEGEQFHNVWELAEYYEDAYIADWKRLNLTEPDIRPRATQHVREQIFATEELIRKGHAYETPTGVYFSVESFPDYGKLSGNTQENLKKAVREAVVVDDNKHDQADFAVWKKDDKHLMQWYSPYGWGFPGWHIECSVMARAYLGDTIDLHSGGEDNIFPHHECEIAQSESLTGKPFSLHWVHTRFLQVNGEKMAKSAGNFYTVRMLLDRGFDPIAIRWALIAGAYNKQYNFTDQGLHDAQANIDRLRRARTACAAATKDGENAIGSALAAIYDEALEAMCSDLNTSVALAKALEGARTISREGESLTRESAVSGNEFLVKIEALLGILGPETSLDDKPGTPSTDDPRIDGLVAERTAAKNAKDFACADAIRKDLEAEGIELRDSPEGTTWVRRRE